MALLTGPFLGRIASFTFLFIFITDKVFSINVWISIINVRDKTNVRFIFYFSFYYQEFYRMEWVAMQVHELVQLDLSYHKFELSYVLKSFGWNWIYNSKALHKWIQRYWFWLFCVDLADRVGEEALIESIHVLITLFPPLLTLPSSKVFLKSFFWGGPKTPPNKAISPGTAALGRALLFEIDIANSISVLFTLRFSFETLPTSVF